MNSPSGIKELNIAPWKILGCVRILLAACGFLPACLATCNIFSWVGKKTAEKQSARMPLWPDPQSWLCCFVASQWRANIAWLLLAPTKWVRMELDQ